MEDSDCYLSDFDLLNDGTEAVETVEQCKESISPQGNRHSHYTKWTKEEDDRLKETAKQCENDWRAVATHFPGKTSTALRKRWNLKHNPTTKHEKWTKEEDETILKMKEELGGGFWKTIAKAMPGRPAEAVKNRYYSVLRRQQTKQPQSDQLQNGHMETPEDAEEQESAPVADETVFEMLNTAGVKDSQKPAILQLSREERMQKATVLQQTLSLLQVLLDKTKDEITILTNELNDQEIANDSVAA